MSEMVERVTRAIAECSMDGPWEDWSERMARVAIAAMREPTVSMMVLGAVAMRTDDLDPTLEEVSKGYGAMIDAALIEAEKENA